MKLETAEAITHLSDWMHATLARTHAICFASPDPDEAKDWAIAQMDKICDELEKEHGTPKVMDIQLILRKTAWRVFKLATEELEKAVQCPFDKTGSN